MANLIWFFIAFLADVSQKSRGWMFSWHKPFHVLDRLYHVMNKVIICDHNRKGTKQFISELKLYTWYLPSDRRQIRQPETADTSFFQSPPRGRTWNRTDRFACTESESDETKTKTQGDGGKKRIMWSARLPAACPWTRGRIHPAFRPNKAQLHGTPFVFIKESSRIFKLLSNRRWCFRVIQTKNPSYMNSKLICVEKSRQIQTAQMTYKRLRECPPGGATHRVGCFYAALPLILFSISLDNQYIIFLKPSYITWKIFVCGNISRCAFVKCDQCYHILLISFIQVDFVVWRAAAFVFLFI